jgi:hypothetical protein
MPSSRRSMSLEVVLGGPHAQRPPEGAPELVPGQPAFPVAASEHPAEQPPGARRVDTECAVQVLEGSSRSSTSGAFTPAFQAARLGTRLSRVYYAGGPDDAEYEHHHLRGWPPAMEAFGQVTALVGAVRTRSEMRKGTATGRRAAAGTLGGGSTVAAPGSPGGRGSAGYRSRSGRPARR